MQPHSPVSYASFGTELVSGHLSGCDSFIIENSGRLLLMQGSSKRASSRINAFSFKSLYIVNGDELSIRSSMQLDAKNITIGGGDKRFSTLRIIGSSDGASTQC